MASSRDCDLTKEDDGLFAIFPDQTTQVRIKMTENRHFSVLFPVAPENVVTASSLKLQKLVHP
jgi:hypothetical protein